jgi:hypothetical protein
MKPEIKIAKQDDKDLTAVFDNGRRGEPLPGCDCMRCFGYCILDADKAFREIADRARNDAAGE